jgi:hypothetical protein
MAASKQGGFKMSLGGLKGKLPLKASTAVKDAKKPQRVAPWMRLARRRKRDRA